MSRKHHRKSHDVAATPAASAPVPVAKVSSGRKTLYALAVLSVAAIGIGIYNSQAVLPSAPRTGEAIPSTPRGAPGSLASMKPFHDFGAISMARGKVRHQYAVANLGGAPITITGVSTSCMCTEATVVTASGRTGPFGMAGHGRMPTIRERLGPGETAVVDVVFDPAAHGPAGVGRIDRAVTVETDAGAPLKLNLVAMVTP